MSREWSPHPRYRLYTGPFSYYLLLRALLPAPFERGDDMARFESEICLRFNVAAAVCVPMARTGLYLALREVIREGQAVIMSPLTIVDVVNMVLLAGGVPVFADIRRQSCTIDPEQAESLIDRHTGALLITHLHGETAGAHVFQEICRRRGLPLIEDAAQAFGAVEQGRRLGTIGDLGIYSFGFYKNLNVWRGGMLVSHDAGLIASVRQRLNELPALPGWRLLSAGLRGLLTDFATWPPLFSTATYPVLRYGILRGIRAVNRMLDPEDGAGRMSVMTRDYLGRMLHAQASLALRQLDRVDIDGEARISRAARYHEALASVDSLITPRRHEGLSHIYAYYPIQYCRREDLLRFALRRGRDFAAQHLRNCADLPEFAELHRNCPNARAAARELILLPTYPRYPFAEIQRNIDVIQEFLRYAATKPTPRNARISTVQARRK